MPECLFCLVDREELTDEHVFPAALGGHLEVKKAACADCNNGFSRAFEQDIARRLADFRRIVGTPDRYGRLPELFVKVEIDGKQLDGKLLRDGAIQLKPIITVNKQNGVTEMTYEHTTEGQRHKLRQQASGERSELMEHTTPGGESEVCVSGQLDFIDSPDMLRTVAKIAYTGLAFRMGERLAMRDTFSAIRQYIRTGEEGASKAKLFLNERFLAASEHGPHQHSIVIVARNDKHRVDAIVRLFGGLCYFVNVSDNYEGADFYDTLVYDAQRGEVNDVLVTNLQTEFLQIEDVESKDTVWNDRVRAGDWFIRFLDREIQSKMKGG
jgi:hypothetical protein